MNRSFYKLQKLERLKIIFSFWFLSVTNLIYYILSLIFFYIELNKITNLESTEFELKIDKLADLLGPAILFGTIIIFFILSLLFLKKMPVFYFKFLYTLQVVPLVILCDYLFFKDIIDNLNLIRLTIDILVCCVFMINFKYFQIWCKT